MGKIDAKALKEELLSGNFTTIYYDRLIADVVPTIEESILDKIRAEIEQLPTKTRTNWNGCCQDIDYPEIEYVDVTKNGLLAIIDKYKTESEEV